MIGSALSLAPQIPKFSVVDDPEGNSVHFKYLNEYEATGETVSNRYSKGKVGFIDEKTEGLKSRDTIP
jgi:hypothetical protein